VLVDLLQPEQGSAFFRKRNRNIIVEVAEAVPVSDEHQWMTLGQVKRLLQVPNLVSMDARTVLSCIPYLTPRAPARRAAAGVSQPSHDDDWERASDFGRALLLSLSEGGTAVHTDAQVMGWLTDLKCRHQLRVDRVGLNDVRGWSRKRDAISQDGGAFFEVVAVRVKAGNREVAAWDQPLIKPVEKGLAAFLVKEFDGVLHFLAQGKIEPGNTDVVVVAPTVQCALGAEMVRDRATWPPFTGRVLDACAGDVCYSGVQSEEGGRFYHVENDYRVVRLAPDDDPELPDPYLWLSLRQLTDLLRYGLVNVEARSLLACLPLCD
jgi:oxidase EvaA